MPPITSWTPQNVYKDVGLAFKEAAGKATAIAKAEAPSATGTLRRSITFAPTGVLSGYIGSPLKYAAAQEEGAGPHPIGPSRKKALYNAKSGYTEFGKPGFISWPGFTIEHPGNPGVGFIAKAGAAFKSLFGAALQKKVRL